MPILLIAVLAIALILCGVGVAVKALVWLLWLGLVVLVVALIVGVARSLAGRS